jgi:hypothetical protein
VKGANPAPNRKKNMKNANRLLIAAAALSVFASAGQSTAFASDGIAASPKVRQMLNERPKAVAAQQVETKQVTTMLVLPQATIAASPKVQQMLNERMRATVAEVGMQTAGYKPTGSDGITASPKARQMLNERPQTIEIAPLK